jgi:hypothetical protein
VKLKIAACVLMIAIWIVLVAASALVVGSAVKYASVVTPVKTFSADGMRVFDNCQLTGMSVESFVQPRTVAQKILQISEEPGVCKLIVACADRGENFSECQLFILANQ